MGYTRLTEFEQVQDHVLTETKPKQRYLLHAGLFIATFVSCIMSGLMWQGENITDLSRWGVGLSYAALIMIFISAHEFGHYFAARYHKVDATLPYFIPMIVWLMPFGTMGALIRTRSPIFSRKVLFDIGVSGPLAGFVVCLIFLIVGLLTLPSPDFVTEIHSRMLQNSDGETSGAVLTFGNSIIYWVLSSVFANPREFLPPMSEIYHYPFLCVGWFGLFVTSLNLLPIGQLDGGHITYAMFGEKQRIIARVVVAFLVAIGVSSVLGFLRLLLVVDSPDSLFTTLQEIVKPPLDWLYVNVPWIYSGWTGWLFWAIFARFFFRLNHPPIQNPEPLDRRRMLVGYVAIAVFIVSISLTGITESEVDSGAPFAKRTVVYRQLQIEE